MTELLNALMDGFAVFHFLRPLWLLALPALLVSGWWARRRERATDQEEGAIAAHLLGPLTLDRFGKRRVRPSDLMVVSGMLCAVAAAGPAWRPAISPFFSETAPVVIALETSTSMLATDVAPSRLDRSKQKILDLLAQRTGARTALVAYAGSAHTVMPLTDDPAVLKSFLEGLEPAIMPVPGDEAAAALALARDMLAKELQRGTVVLVTDGVAASQLPLIEADEASLAAGVVALVVGTEAGGAVRFEDGSLALDSVGRPLRAAVDQGLLAGLEARGVPVVRSSVDQGDVMRLVRRIRSNRERAGEDQALPFRDEGYWLLFPAALIGLLWYRRGFTMQWVLLGALWLGFGVPEAASAETFLDLWLTPDQQGRLLMERGEPETAATRFADPMWRGVAAYRAGDNEVAVVAFGAVGSADGEYNLGNAYVGLGDYAHALAAYRRAIALDPGHRAASANLSLMAEILAHEEEAEEDSEASGDLGADEVKFDLEKGKGKKARIDSATQLDVGAAEQWMRQVETRTRDFLELRFAIDEQRKRANE